MHYHYIQIVLMTINQFWDTLSHLHNFLKDASLDGIQNPTYGKLGQFNKTPDDTSTLGGNANGTVIANVNEAASMEDPTKSDNLEELVESVSNRYDVKNVYAL